MQESQGQILALDFDGKVSKTSIIGTTTQLVSREQEDAQGTPTQSHISPSILVYEEKGHVSPGFWGKSYPASSEQLLSPTQVQSRSRSRSEEKTTLNILVDFCSRSEEAATLKVSINLT